MAPLLKTLNRNNLELLLRLVSKCANARSEINLSDLLSELHSFIPYDAVAVLACAIEGAQINTDWPQIIYIGSESDTRKIRNPDADMPVVVTGQVANVPDMAATIEGRVRSQLCKSSCNSDLQEDEVPRIHTVGEFVSVCMPPAKQLTITCVSLLGDAAEISYRGAVILPYLMPYLGEALERIYPPNNRRATDSLRLPLMHRQPGGVHEVRHQQMTGRESEILKWVAQGKSNWEIAMILFISERTVKYHVGNIYRKLDATNRAQAIAKAAQWGLLSNIE